LQLSMPYKHRSTTGDRCGTQLTNSITPCYVGWSLYF
jgi:NAD(P)-dependent dehydrogenase (short-subunit alcohol dehydrogenase family)